MHTPSRYFPELLSTVLLQFLNCRVYSHVEKPLGAPNAHLLSQHFGGGCSLKEAEGAALLSLSFRSVGPALLQGFLCEECSSAERGKYQAAPESPVLKTLLATSVMAVGNRVGERQRSLYLSTPPPPGPPCCSWCLH